MNRLSATRFRTGGVSCTILLMVCQAVAIGQAPPASDWQGLDAKVAELYSRGDLPQAIVAAEAALRAAVSPAESGRSLDRLGFLHYTSGNFPDGEKYLRQSLEVREAAFGTESLAYAETANDLALLLRDLHRMDDAKRFAERAVATRLRVLGDNDLSLAESLNTLGTVYGLNGEYETAVLTFMRAMAVHESRAAPERATEEYGTLCINLAGTYQRLGKYALAEAAFGKGLDALRLKPGITHPAYAVSLLGYGALKVDLGRYQDAERLYEESGQLIKAELGELHPMYAAFLNNRGFLLQLIGNHAAAEADYEHSLELKKKLFGPVSLSAASTMRNLAQLTYSRNHEQGERLLAEAVAVYAKSPNAPPFDYASTLLGLGRAQRDRGALSDARATLQQVLAVTRQGLGVRHPLFAAAVRDLGLVDAASGDDAAATRNLREAIDIAADVHGPNHPDLAAFLDALAGFYAQRGDYQAALPLYRRSFDIQDRFLSDVLEIGSEHFKALSIATSLDPVPALIALQSKAAAQIPAARVLAFEAVTRRKGRVLEQVRVWRERLRENATDDVRRRLSQWQAILACRTSLTVALGYRDIKPSVVGACDLDGTDLEGRYERLLSDLRTRRTEEIGTLAVRAIGVLQERGDALEASLNRETGGSNAGAKHTSVDDIASRLRDDEALIEFVSYEGAGGDGSAGRRYGAFVLDSKSKLEWSDVGSATPIDSSVRDLLNAANDWSVSVRNHEGQAARSGVRTAQDALTDLSKKVWTPLKPLIEARPGVQRLRIAPDASLNLVPFEAFSDERDLIERFTITYVPAGRDLTMEEFSRAPSAAPVVVVSPGESARRDRVHQPGTPFRTAGLARLTAAAGEAADFRRLVPRAEIYAAANATERRVKSLHGPSLLHIVGHGIIQGDEDCKGPICVSAGLDPSARAMALSAIVLEEAYGRSQASVDDGMLTPLELQNVDLRGTEMLVLSQCQMANGLASVGEGVYGMRRAAAIAGARSFVAPLWNVQDDVQRTLMARFYTDLAAGQTRADALRHAKLQLRQSPATRSFLYWAPVILSGSASALPLSLFDRRVGPETPGTLIAGPHSAIHRSTRLP
jgi:CHAT domain-containing protein/tetratricopeptide (TPR) repeat protein